MLLDAFMERFSENIPLTVMTRGLLENALQPAHLDDLFERVAEKQYTKELLFSTLVDTMALVACRIYKSPRAVYLEHSDRFGVVLKNVYDKLKGIELPVMREMVRDNARRLRPVIEELEGELPALLPGYRVKILDGNALAGTHHRIAELRGARSAALPGKSLVVLDSALGLAVDVIPCEDGYAQERSLFEQILLTVMPQDLWIEDRNFCTLGFIFGVIQRDASVLVREHKGLPWEALSGLKYVGRVATGAVYEQEVKISEGGRTLRLRRIVIRLDEPTRDGDMEVALLTDVRRVSATKLAQLYVERWSIEGLFNVLTTSSNCEVSSLGYPKAALFAFCVTLLAYNVLATVKAALRSVHGNDKVEEEVSVPKVSEHVGRNYDGMMAGLPPEHWLPLRTMRAKELASWLRELAAKVDLEKVRKAVNKPRKKTRKDIHYDPSKPHISTARLLAERRGKSPPTLSNNSQ
jgi:hypothetical protein